MYYGIFWTGILLTIAETAFVGAILSAVNVGVNLMLSTFTAAVGYFYSIVLYGEKLNFFCVTGSICILIGMYKIIFWKW